MNRRKFLAASGAAAVTSVWCGDLQGNRVPPQPHPIRVAIETQRKLGTIPPNFLGLGYETSSVAIPDLLSAENRTYVQLVRTLSPEGVIRVGGNTSDYAVFQADGKAVSAPKGTVVNTASLQKLGTFLDATNWRLIWGLNLGSADQHHVVAEAEAVARAVGDKLLAFEIGNEPDLFGRGTAHRPAGYNYDAFIDEFRRYKTAIRAKLANAPFAGPDVASATDWVTRFAADEGGDLKLLTHHYYRECANPTSTLNKLLRSDPKLRPELATLQKASAIAQAPYRICEANSFCGGGKPGVSDTFVAALWVLDFLFLLAYAGCAGANIETGVNQLGFVSSYSPVRRRDRGAYFAAPIYYGMLAFARGSQGQRLAVDSDTAGANVTAYAVMGDRADLSVTVLNKDPSLDVDVSLSAATRLGEGQVFRLSGPSLQSKDGITFGGSAVDSNGTWKPGVAELVHSSGNRATIRIPAGSAAVLKWAL